MLILREGSEIKLIDKEIIADGILYGVVESNEGYFPAKYATDTEVSFISFRFVSFRNLSN